MRKSTLALALLVAAVVESLPIAVDDNLTVTFSGGAAMALTVYACSA